MPSRIDAGRVLELSAARQAIEPGEATNERHDENVQHGAGYEQAECQSMVHLTPGQNENTVTVPQTDRGVKSS